MAGKSSVAADEEQRRELVALSHSRDRGEADRARAIVLTLSGWTSAQIAEAFGVREDTGRFGPVAKFWRLPCVEHTGRMGASEPEAAHDPECDCREAEAPVEGRFQGPPLRSDADPAGRLLVPALPAQLS